MRWSLHLLTFKGIKIKMHITFLFIVAWGAYSYGRGHGIQGLIFGALLILLIFGIVLLHELGHSLAAMHYGIRVRDIMLLPIGGVARLERMPEKPYQEFVVAIAGPAVNMLLIIVFIPLLWLTMAPDILHSLFFFRPGLGPSGQSLVRVLFFANLSLLIFNMIPAFPLDGGRILRALLAMFLDYQNATKVAVWIGQGFAILLGIYAVFWEGSFMTGFIALFIFLAGGAEGKSVSYKRVLDKISVRQAFSRINTVLQPNFTVMEAASLTLGDVQSHFPVFLGGVLIGIIRRSDIRRALRRGENKATVAQFMQRDFLRFGIDTKLSDVQNQLILSNSSVGAVYEGPHFMGLIGFEDIEHAFSLKPIASTQV